MQIIRGVTYRHVAGYLRVVGLTQHSAEQHTKAVGTRLIEKLPPGTEVKPGRYKGIVGRLHVYEVPVVLNRPGVREILTDFANAGDLQKLSA